MFEFMDLALASCLNEDLDVFVETMESFPENIIEKIILLLLDTESDESVAEGKELYFKYKNELYNNKK